MPKRPLLSTLPPPLLHELVAGRWLPIVGAGLSMNAVVPGVGNSLPNWIQLGEQIAKDLPPAYVGGTPLESVSAYEHAYGRPRLVDRVMRALQAGTAQPGRVHQEFCAIPFDVVVTTNVEQILEMEYRARHGAVLAVTEEQQLRLPNPYRGPVLMKLHGDLHHPASLVLTERDYDEFALKRPLYVTWLANQLISKTGVLIGYSLEDADFRQVLALLRSRLGETAPDLYVVEVAADPVKVDRYIRRGVKVINLPRTASGYGILADLFGELYAYWSAHFSSSLTGTTASVRALLRAGSRSSIAVLFLVREEHLSLYDEYVFPKLVESGLIPLTLQDVSHPTGYRVATLDALLRVAGKAVVEDDDVSPSSLRSKASSMLGSDQVLRVTSRPSGLGVEDGRVLVAPNTVEDWEAFGTTLAAELWESVEVRDFWPPDSGGPTRSAYSLDKVSALDGMRATVIVGLIRLESRIRELASRGDRPLDSRRPTGFRQVLEYGLEHLSLPIDQAEGRRIVSLRNSLVHGQEDFSEDLLREVNGQILRLHEALDRYDLR